ncbi:MAG: VOC family protein [Gemmatimonadetes bacterium]|nr:VOC family protein [Gemmatimonadota bacterium]
MRITHTSVTVDDQQKALRFYTETLGFQLKHNIPLGEHSWITLVSEDDPDGTELVLEPDAYPPMRPFKKALVEDSIPWTAFTVDNVEAEHERLVAKGVRFVQPPTDAGDVVIAAFDDTCGNLIQIMAQKDQA